MNILKIFGMNQAKIFIVLTMFKLFLERERQKRDTDVHLNTHFQETCLNHNYT